MDIMFDLETLDTRPSAVILSIGAVRFNSDTGEITDEFYRNLSIQAQLDNGRTVSESTLLWWLDQDRTAIDAAFRGPRSTPSDALVDFKIFSDKTAINKFWCNGPAFDGVLWESLARTFKDFILVPWKYNQLRDQRTLVDTAKVRIADLDMSHITGVPHHPIFDCEVQVHIVTTCLNKLKGGFNV